MPGWWGHTTLHPQTVGEFSSSIPLGVCAEFDGVKPFYTLRQWAYSILPLTNRGNTRHYDIMFNRQIVPVRMQYECVWARVDVWWVCTTLHSPTGGRNWLSFASFDDAEHVICEFSATFRGCWNVLITNEIKKKLVHNNDSSSRPSKLRKIEFESGKPKCSPQDPFDPYSDIESFVTWETAVVY